MSILEPTAQEAVEAMSNALPVPGQWNFRAKHSTVERMPIALDMLRLYVAEGWTYKRIADYWGCRHPTVMTYIKMALETYPPVATNAHRQEMVLRLYEKLADWDEAARSDAKAIDAWLKIADKIINLTGLDAPVLINATVHEVTAEDSELQGILDQAKRDALMEEAALRTITGEVVPDISTDIGQSDA